MATKSWLGKPSPATNTLPLLIGKYQGDKQGHFKGLIDDVAIYDRVLSPAEVSLLHDAKPAETISSASGE